MNTSLISLYRNFTQNTHRGFASPLALGLGLIMMLAATTAMVRSQDEQVSTKVQHNSNRSLSAAQIGVNRYQDLINQNKIIATHNACVTSWNNGTCQDSGTVVSWAKASNIPAINPSCPSAGSSVVTAATHQNWIDINSSNPELGQYRLVDYTFDSGRNIGTLVVEGRVNPQSDASTAITRLAVELPVQPGIVNTKVAIAPRFNSMNPAVWLGSNTVTAMGNVKVDGNILLSNATCSEPTGTGKPTVANLQNASTQAVIVDPRSLPSTPTPSITTNAITNAEIINAMELPRASDVGDANNFYHYNVTDSLNLSNHTLKIRQGTKVIIHVQGNITLDGNVEINEGTTNHSAYLEIYGTNTTTAINFTGLGQQNLKAFIHAPNATVNLSSSGLNVNLIGAIWVNDWNSSNGVMNVTADDQYIHYRTIDSLITGGVNRVVDPLIFAPSHWDTQEVN